MTTLFPTGYHRWNCGVADKSSSSNHRSILRVWETRTSLNFHWLCLLTTYTAQASLQLCCYRGLWRCCNSALLRPIHLNFFSELLCSFCRISGSSPSSVNLQWLGTSIIMLWLSFFQVYFKLICQLSVYIIEFHNNCNLRTEKLALSCSTRQFFARTFFVFSSASCSL